VLGGVGIAGVAGFVALNLVGAHDYDGLKHGCGASTGCSGADIDPVRTKYYLSYVSLGVGAAALAGAVVVYLVAPTRGRDQALYVAPNGSGVDARYFMSF